MFDLNPPPNSKIKIESKAGHKLLVLTEDPPDKLRIIIVLFLLVWLGGWSAGFISALNTVLAGKGGAFLIFWLAGWSLGGVFVPYVLYLVLRRPVPEQLWLNKPNLTMDTGLPAINAAFAARGRRKDVPRSNPFKRRVIQFTQADMRSLSLRETGSGNRLTIDQNNKRIDLALSASEVEREWLYHYLQDEYPF